MNSRRKRLYEIIFESDTKIGKTFDVGLIVIILLSVLVVMLDSVKAISVGFGSLFYVMEWIFTVLFTVEYLIRLYCSPNPLRYARNFFGIIDLIAVLPTYFSLFFPAGKYLLVIRILRVLRIFRVFKLIKFVHEANLLLQALNASRRKIIVFMYTVFSMVIIFGSLMYVIETEANGFTSIPRSIYWAIVTLTTVGYGDISPATNLGQTLAAMIMLLGYSIIAVPTGIVTAEIARAAGKGSKRCPHRDIRGHDQDAFYCKHCGEKLSIDKHLPGE